MSTKNRDCETELEGLRERYRELYIDFKKIKRDTRKGDAEFKILLERASDDIRKLHSEQEHLIRTENGAGVYEITLEEFDMNWKYNLVWHQELRKLQ